MTRLDPAPAASGRRGLRLLAGVASVLAGAWLLVPGLPRWPAAGFKYEKLAELKIGEAGLPELGGRFPVVRLTRYGMATPSGSSLELNVAQYRDDQGRIASALVYPLDNGAITQSEGSVRRELWAAAAKAILSHSAEEALFVAWWDDAQRLRFFTGRKTWSDAPVAEAFADAEQQAFWRQAGGEFATDPTQLKLMARWLSMDAEEALAEMGKTLPQTQAVYVLACLDDLARLKEIETLSGVKLPFEARYFPQSADIHNQIAGVKHWAEENGFSSYLVQQLPSGGVRAWRITTEAGSKTLLARLLPFTTSLAHPMDALSLVYQSGWGGYLSVYQWRH